jgi:hypothetical protein
MITFSVGHLHFIESRQLIQQAAVEFRSTAADWCVHAWQRTTHQVH